MLQLESKDYFKGLPLLDHVNINTMFARAVLEHLVPGSVYVDAVHNPRAFYVVHSYGMSLLFGEAGNEAFTRGLHDYMTNQAGGDRVRSGCKVIRQQSGPLSLILFYLFITAL